MKIVFASNNQGKITELADLISVYNLEIIPQNVLQVREIAETGLTFIENALLKARNACIQTNLPAIADDSGLEVFALQGAPGIYSARFSGDNATAEKNISKLLNDLVDTSDDDRKARYYCVLVYLQHAYDPTPLICEASWEGRILSAPVGVKGFGYDPIFFDEKEKCSAAELSLSQKNLVSHRGKALRLLMEKLPQKLIPIRFA